MKPNVLMTCALALVLATAAEAATNLVVREVTPIANPSFEQGLKGWSWLGDPALAVEPGGIAGSNCLAITVGPTQVKTYAYAHQPFRLESDKKYYVSARIRTQGKVWGSLRVVGGAGGEPSSQSVRFDQDWTEAGVCFLATEKGSSNPGESACDIRLQVEGYGGGTVRFDDLRVYELMTYRPCLRVRLIEPAGEAAEIWFTAFHNGLYSNSERYTPGKGQTDLPWIDLGQRPGFKGGGATPVGLHVESRERKAFERVKARIDFAYAPEEQAILKTVEIATPGNVLGVFVPGAQAVPEAFRLGFRPLAEDIAERNRQVRALALPPVDLKRFYVEAYLNGYGKNYSDPQLLNMEMDTIRRIGFSGIDSEYSGLAGAYRQAAERVGIRRTHQTIRTADRVSPTAKRIDFDEAAIRKTLVRANGQALDAIEKEDAGQLPLIQYLDLGDEIAGPIFAGPLYERHYRDYLKEHGVAPADLGRSSWDEVHPVSFQSWRDVVKCRPDRADVPACRNYYWTLRHWNYCAAWGYRVATEELGRRLPQAPTCVDFGSPWEGMGVLPRGAEMWEFARQHSVTAMLNEDWLNTANWRRSGIQMNAGLVDYSRSIAAAAGGLPVIEHVMPSIGEEEIQLKLASVVGKGCKAFDVYRYGPAYANNNDWSNNERQMRGVARFTRALAAFEDLVFEGRPPKAEVALIWSASESVWQESNATTYDQTLVYLALLHRQVPVDFIDEFEVERGRLKDYKVVYLTSRHVRAAAQQALADWVRDGGRLWANATAGTTDETAQPTSLLAPVFGIAHPVLTISTNSPSFEPQHGLPVQNILDEVVAQDGVRTPVVGARCAFTLSDPAGSTVLATFTNGAPAAVECVCEKGRVLYAGFYPGLSYALPVKRIFGAIETGYREQDRRLIVDFALRAGVRRPVECSAPMVEADWLGSTGGVAVVLANYTGEKQARIELHIAVSREPKAVRSAVRGELRFTYDAAAGRVHTDLPLDTIDFVAAR